MYEVLVFLFENYFSQQTTQLTADTQKELSAAGFEEEAIFSALNWVEQLNSLTNLARNEYLSYTDASRVLSEAEKNKIQIEGLSFVLFLAQANVISAYELDLILDRAMALSDLQISLEQMRWITMMALWSSGRQKEYLFVEDALFNPRGQTVH